jgi:hypothetical protein
VEINRYQLIRDRLLEAWPRLGQETLADSLEGITDLQEMIAAVIRSALVDEALQIGLRTRVEEMRHRLARLEERGAKKRQLALKVSDEFTVPLCAIHHSENHGTGMRGGGGTSEKLIHWRWRKTSGRIAAQI